MSISLAILILQVGSRSSSYPWKTFLDAPNIIAAVSAIAAVVAAVLTLLPIWTQWRTNKLLARSFGSDLYSPEVLERSTHYYVEPNCSSIDPTYESEIRNTVATEQKLFAVLDRLLSRDSRLRHVLILGDSGMGKSSCLLNYYVRNQRAKRNKKRIAIVPLGIPEADRHIGSIEKKRETILFLDAFDEDTKAIQDHKERLQSLMELASDFSRVLITCRTQFFLKDEEIPKQTGIVVVAPRSGGEKGVYEFYKLYLSPLDNEQVETFLHKRYPIWRLRKRTQARALIEAVPLLTVRPMLLTYIPELLELGRPIRYSYELYEALVDSWLERESRWVDKESLLRFSESLAVDLYYRREERGAERIQLSDLDHLAKEWSVPLESWQLTGRSLLNRDAAGNYKFAHRSIMEYLFVKRYLKGDPLTVNVKWTDQMYDFLIEIVNNNLLGENNFFDPGELLRRVGRREIVLWPHLQVQANPHRSYVSIQVLQLPHWIRGLRQATLVISSQEELLKAKYNLKPGDAAESWLPPTVTATYTPPLQVSAGKGKNYQHYRLFDSPDINIDDSKVVYLDISFDTIWSHPCTIRVYPLVAYPEA